jgi:fused signal recognition particle receptor
LAGKSVMLVAADTFRAAAVEQLAIWATRAQAEFHRGEEGQDPASVAFDGIKRGLELGVDVILIDTAGRLHTQKNLVEELKKIVRVCDKAHEGAPHETLLVLDSTTGQNAIQQANIFGEAVGLDGIVLTKLDGTAKGGVVIGICDQMQIPVKFIGVGEQVEDLLPFEADSFLDGLFGDSQPTG